MGYSNRVPDMLAKWARERELSKELVAATAAVESFNRRTAAGKPVVAWPTIGAALAAKHHWVAIHCKSCNALSDLDLRVKRRNPDVPITAILSDLRCPRCNGHG